MSTNHQPIKIGHCWGVQNDAGQVIVEPEFTEFQAHTLAFRLDQNPDIDPDDLYAGLVQS